MEEVGKEKEEFSWNNQSREVVVGEQVEVFWVQLKHFWYPQIQEHVKLPMGALDQLEEQAQVE